MHGDVEEDLGSRKAVQLHLRRGSIHVAEELCLRMSSDRMQQGLRL
jgi:hypothetical protein